MPDQVVETPYPLIDSDPHAGRVVRYFRPSDYAAWAAGTAAFPGAFYALEVADRTRAPLRVPLRICTALGFVGGFLFAYQRSSLRFWGWTENKREYDRDLAELTQRAKEGKPLYGESNDPAFVQAAAHRNSLFSQIKFGAIPWFNLSNHPYHGTDPAKYGVKSTPSSSEQ
ncbi:hypothetical protein SISNIDRAFT_453554 [Sistotremastrum niveocremeum HHB9708]|uniref:NADH-ubiquinone oxidoreductase 21 kDa subunit n=1 Tax=Sistotremastrum niveocremeum HHB9708 TaxID=1314777 RepID=A0A164VZ99_9AGAM|nr:hypothetical protein SISNIDRAFT_453554 [Sistotremastrum niveocremeum HHB9708]